MGTRRLIADRGFDDNVACSPFNLETPYGFKGLYCRSSHECRALLGLATGIIRRILAIEHVIYTLALTIVRETGRNVNE